MVEGLRSGELYSSIGRGCFFDTILHSDITAFEVWSERVKILIVNTLYDA